MARRPLERQIQTVQMGEVRSGYRSTSAIIVRLTGRVSEGYYRHLLRLDGGCGSLGEDVADATYFGAHGFQFFFDVLVASIQVIDAVDDGLAVGDQGGKHQRGGGAQVRGEYGRGAKRSSAAYDGAAAFDLDIGAHAHKFLRVHEAVLEDILGDDRRACGLRGERHVLRLHVGRE